MAWGHSIELPKDDKTAMGREADVCAHGMRCPEKRLQSTVRPERIYGGRDYYVGGPAVYVAYFNYVTGRAGRVGLREMPLCETCGGRFAAKHKLDLPSIVQS